MLTGGSSKMISKLHALGHWLMEALFSTRVSIGSPKWTSFVGKVTVSIPLHRLSRFFGSAAFVVAQARVGHQNEALLRLGDSDYLQRLGHRRVPIWGGLTDSMHYFRYEKHCDSERFRSIEPRAEIRPQTWSFWGNKRSLEVFEPKDFQNPQI